MAMKVKARRKDRTSRYDTPIVYVQIGPTSTRLTEYEARNLYMELNSIYGGDAGIEGGSYGGGSGN